MLLEPTFRLKVAAVSEGTRKGRHTTVAAQLLRLSSEGTVIDTPGVRQFELWDTEAGEIEGFFVELRPFAAHCRFPGCTHTHEDECAVKTAVYEQLVSIARYESYVRMLEDSMGL